MGLPESVFRKKESRKENKEKKWNRLKSERKDIHLILSESYPELHTDGMVSALHPIYRALVKKVKAEKENVDKGEAEPIAQEALEENYVNKLKGYDLDLKFLQNKNKKEVKNFVKKNLFEEEEKQERYEKAFNWMEEEYNDLRL